jgi:hypothetical protein
VSVDMTPEMREEIARDLRKTRAPARTAKNLVLDVMEDERQPRPFREEKYGGLGRPEIQQYIVDRKRPWEIWANTTDPVLTARNQYEAGTHEMATGRDGDWLILYSIPRKTVAKDRQNYFQPENM